MTIMKMQITMFVMIACVLLKNEARPVYENEPFDECCFKQCYPIEKCLNSTFKITNDFPNDQVQVEQVDKCCFQMCYSEESCQDSPFKKGNELSQDIIVTTTSMITTTTTTTPATTTEKQRNLKCAPLTQEEDLQGTKAYYKNYTGINIIMNMDKFLSYVMHSYNRITNCYP